MKKNVILIVSGALLSLSFAPLHIYALAYMAPAILCYCWIEAKPKQASLKGLLFGLGFFTAGVSWVYISIHNFGGASIVIASFITAVFIFILSLYFVLQGCIFSRLFHRYSDWQKCLCLFPITWVGFEWLRIHLFTGFPWLMLGYSTTATPLFALAPIIGSYGLSFIVAAGAGSLALLARRNSYRMKTTAVAVIVLPLLLGLALNNKTWTQLSKKSVTATIIQGNVPLALKWQPVQLDPILLDYARLIQKQKSHQLIILPESAFPVIYNQIPGYIALLQQMAIKHHNTIIAGTLYFDHKTQTYYNRLLMIGKYKGTYNKRHLVPFGEYIPMPIIFNWLFKLVNIPMSDMHAGAIKQPPLMYDKQHIAAFICYEISFPDEALAFSKNAGLIVNISDDTWFGKSIAASQQFQMTQMRAKELGRYVLVCSNSGVSAIIDPRGKIIATVPLFKRAVFSAKAYFVSGKTPLQQYGYWPVWIFILVLLLLCIGCHAFRKD